MDQVQMKRGQMNLMKKEMKKESNKKNGILWDSKPFHASLDAKFNTVNKPSWKQKLGIWKKNSIDKSQNLNQ